MARRHFLMGVVLSAFLGAQTFVEPAILFALTSTSTDSVTTGIGTDSGHSGTTVINNPTYDEINQKLEAVAKEKNIPSILLKAIAFRESTWHQFDSKGQPLLGGPSTHPAIGIMQVATYSDTDLETIEKLKTDIDFNIRKGAELLDEKWRFTPRIGDGDRNKLENWYFALWAYHTWSEKNNPNVIAAQNEAGINNPPKVAYQDSILELCANPDGFLAQYIEPVTISKIPASLLPKEGVPSKTVQWATPEPIHYGDLNGANDPSPPVGAQPPLEFIRLAGNDRIDTAIQQALKGWPTGASTVVLARADDFPDALAGVSLAAKWGAPILLTPSHELDPRVQKMLQMLKPERVYLLGGEGALGNTISAKLKELGWGAESQVRLGGANRYETAMSIALETVRADGAANSSIPNDYFNRAAAASNTSDGLEGSSSSIEAVALATGENFPDALSIASIAGVKKMPILLTGAKEVPEETLRALLDLNPQKVYILGGDGAISSTVEAKVRAQLNLPESSILRLQGATRYDTMAAVAAAFAGETQGLSFATGEDFPDALAGAALAARLKAAVILLPKTSLEQYANLKAIIDDYPRNLTAQPYIFGGVGAVSREQEQELKMLLSGK